MYESSIVVAKLELDFSNGIHELYPDSYKAKRWEMEKKEEIYSKNLEKKRLKVIRKVIQHLVKRLKK